MPKIKIKNIPKLNVERICDCHIHCHGCSLYSGEELYQCMRDPRIEPKETIIELSEKDFPTNREWMESLLNEELAALLTTGLLIIGGKYDGLKATSSLIIDKESMLDWLSQPCAYLMEE